MSEQDRTEQKRPESFDDLAQDQYDTRPKQVASIDLDVATIGTGLLAAAEQVIIALRQVHGDALVVATDDGKVTATRPLTDDEKAEVLGRHQDTWDRRHKQMVEAEQRAHLKVGDPLDIGRVTTCRLLNQADCDLHYEHVGDHFKVEDGRVVRRTKRTSR